MLEEKVSRFSNRHGLIQKGARILVGVSGGPDSLALLHYLWNRREELQLTIVVGHFDHMFRGKESYEDLLFVENYCNNLHIPLEVAQKDVLKYIEETGKSTQVAARECRYAFFEQVMEKHRLDFLALGHHGDDQVETILMRLTRGSSGHARGGIPVKRNFARGKIIRPFLSINKEEIERYCLRNELHPRLDPSNKKDLYIRNRLRKEVLTSLKRENSLVHEHFQRFSEEIQEDEAYLQQLTVQAMNNLLEKKNNERVVLNIKPFLSLPNSLQRRGIQLILNYLYEERPNSLSATHLTQVLTLIKKTQPSGTLHLPLGLHVIRSYEKCVFQYSLQKEQDYYFEIHRPGTITLPNGSKITMEYGKPFVDEAPMHTVILDPHVVKLPLIVRTRKDGDRMNPKGMSGSKKTKSIFIEEKIPIIKRDEWPIVTDSNGEILWLPGLKKSHWDISNTQQTHYITLTYSSNDHLGGINK